MKYAFDVVLYTRPADRGERQEHRVVLYAATRYEAVERFWSAISKAGFGISPMPTPEPEEAAPSESAAKETP